MCGGKKYFFLLMPSVAGGRLRQITPLAPMACDGDSAAAPGTTADSAPTSALIGHGAPAHGPDRLARSTAPGQGHVRAMSAESALLRSSMHSESAGRTPSASSSSPAQRTSHIARHLAAPEPDSMSSSSSNNIARINAPDLPSAAHIYSHLVAVPATAKLLYLSGQVPSVPETGALVEGDIKASTAQCISNLERALRAGGADLTHLVKVNIYLKDMDDFDAVNEVYNRLIPAEHGKPARTCLQVGKCTYSLS